MKHALPVQAGQYVRVSVADQGIGIPREHLARIFDQIFILTEGGPGFSTETVSLYIYRTAFRFSDFGYAAAMSFVLLLFTNFISAGYIRLLQKQETA